MYEWDENLLPLPSHNFGVEPTHPVARTKMDNGRVRQRPRFSEPVKEAAVIWELTRLQYALFVAIFEGKLNNGTRWFKIRLPREDDSALTLTEVRFITSYKAQHIPFENWRITARIEFKDGKSPITEDILDLITCYTTEELAAMQQAANNP